MNYKERLARDIAHETMRNKVRELVAAFEQEVYRQTYSYWNVRTDNLLDEIKQLDEQGHSIKCILDDRSGGGGWIIQVYSTQVEEAVDEEDDEEDDEEGDE